MSGGGDEPTITGPIPGAAPTVTGPIPGAPHLGGPHPGFPQLRGTHVNHHLRGLHRGRLRGHLVLVTFMVGLAGAVGLGALAVVLAAPSKGPLCQPYTPCGPPRAGAPLVNQTLWRSSEYGFSLEYPGSLVTVSQRSASGLMLDVELGNSSGTIVVQGAPAQVTPARAVTAQLANLPGISQISVDSSPADQLLGPGVGYRTGAGGVYTGYQDAAQGVGGEQAIYSQSATDGRVTVTVTVVAPASLAGPKAAISQVADDLINSVRWA